MLGEKIEAHKFIDIRHRLHRHQGFAILICPSSQGRPVLGVDMSSTGEVGCLGKDFDEALLNAMISVGHHVPNGAVLVSSGDVRGKVDMLDACRLLDENGYKIYATEGTARFLNNNGIEAQAVCWPDEEGENVLDLIADTVST